jgi:TolA-binding protein
MTDDPVRLLDEEDSGMIHTLLSAAREEQPHSAALRRTLAAVGVGTALTAHAGSAARAATLGSAKGATPALAVVAKWLAIGAVSGGLASSAVYAVSGALAPSSPPAATSAAPTATPALAPVPAPRALPGTAPTAELQESPTPAVVVSPPALQPSAPVASSPEPDPGPPLSAEVAALDSARKAAKAADADRALALLADYETRFPDARMLPEALYLRLEAFTLKGDRSNAEAVARRILRVYPSSPHAARARAVLGLSE